MPFCCGKDRQCNFCPECGKAMDKTAGLRGLLRYVTGQYELANKRAEKNKSDWEYARDSQDSSSWRVNETLKREKAYKASVKKMEQWREWQEALIKAIDGE